MSPEPSATPRRRRTPAPPGKDKARKPVEVRLPGFLVEEEIGLGDLIKRATSVAGIRPCTGCSQRAARLNRAVRIVPR